MTTAAVVVTLLLVAEFSFAPVNLWTGRTMGNFTAHTGLPPRFATHFLAPVKLIGALVLVTGLFLRAASIAGSALAIAISCFYLVRLAAKGRRDPAGLTGFTVGELRIGVEPCLPLAPVVAFAPVRDQTLDATHGDAKLPAGDHRAFPDAIGDLRQRQLVGPPGPGEAVGQVV